MGSYNYLGFAENEGLCADSAKTAVMENGIAACSTRHEFGKKKDSNQCNITPCTPCIIIISLSIILLLIGNATEETLLHIFDCEKFKQINPIP